MSRGIIKGDRLTWTGGCGRSRSYHTEFPTWLHGRAGRSAERDGVFSDEKEDSLFYHFFYLITLVKMLGEIITSLGNIKSRWDDCSYS